MCLLCIEMMKGKMTIREIGRALMEIKLEDSHEDDFLKALSEKYTPSELFDYLLRDEVNEKK